MSNLRKGLLGEPTLDQVPKLGGWLSVFMWFRLTHPFPVRALCYHPSQPLLATGGDDGRVKVWPANAMEITRVKFRYQENLSLNLRIVSVLPGTPTM